MEQGHTGQKNALQGDVGRGNTEQGGAGPKTAASGTAGRGNTEPGIAGPKAAASGTVSQRNTEPGGAGQKTAIQKNDGKALRRKAGQRVKRKKTKQKKESTRKWKWNWKPDGKSFFLGLATGALAVLLALAILSHSPIPAKEEPNSGLEVDASEPEINVQLLDVNEYSRPGTELKKITGIVIHYTANPGSSAQANRDYFNGLQDGRGTSVSSHFVVGLEGEIVQCVPTWEIAYASNQRNRDTISIECCHPDETGKFTDATYVSMVRLTAFLCAKFGLDADAVIRHYDVTEKNCPKYFVENEDAWTLFKADVKAALQKEEGENTDE